MKHIAYSKIENASDRTVNYIKMHGGKPGFENNWDEYSDDFKFVVTEKIHGSNYAFYCNGQDLKVASRSKFLSETSNFFGHQAVIEKYKEKIFHLYNNLMLNYNEVKPFTKTDIAPYIIVYGELFGGYFNNKDIYKETEIDRTKPVQKGVSYIPFIDFRCFDIRFVQEYEGQEIPLMYYIKFQKMMALCDEVDIPVVQPVFSGSLDECLKYKNVYRSLIPFEYGIEKYAPSDNICEGNVIRQLVPDRISSLFDYTNRIVLKHKNENFSEITKKNKKEKVEEDWTDNAKQSLEDIQDYITENRLDNIWSKIGSQDEFVPKDFGKLLGLYSQDVITDFYKDNDNIFDCSEIEQKRFRKTVTQYCAKFLKPLVL